MPTEMEDYLFDLRGYVVLKNAIAPSLLEALNRAIDALPPVPQDGWLGHLHYRHYRDAANFHLQNIFEAGAPFEELIDHPAWLGHVQRYVGGDDGLFIDEAFADLRGPGKATRLHSGAHKRRIRTQFRFHNDQFRCGQINVLMALRDIGPGDGATMVIPGSHKSNLLHPAFKTPAQSQGPESLDDVEGAVEVFLRAGDAVLFVDCLAHGSARRVNAGQRRILIYRYGPHWGNNRYGYQPSDALLARLTPERRRIIQPLPPMHPPITQ